MKKLEIFSNNLAILQSIDPYLADNSPIYRMGVITQFNRTSETRLAFFPIPRYGRTC